MDIQFLNVNDLIQDFWGFGDFVLFCGMSDQLQITEPSEMVMARLKPLGIRAQIHLCAPGEIMSRWGVDAMGFAVPDEKLDGSWHVAVQSNTRPNDVLTGTLLHELGHYVEQIASGKGYLKGKYAQRGTSFDEACRYLAKVIRVGKTAPVVVESADELVANLNAAWLAMASGIEPVHAAATLLSQATHPSMVGLSKAIRRDSQVIANAMTQRGFYAEFIESIGWDSEEEMCLVMDTATTRLLDTLRRRSVGSCARAQVPKTERDATLLVGSNVLCNRGLRTASAYLGTFGNVACGDGVGGRIGTVIVVDSEHDVFALLYCNPTPIKGPDGSYRMQTENESRETRVTAVVETPGREDMQMGIEQFISEHPHLAEKVRKQLVVVGLGL